MTREELESTIKNGESVWVICNKDNKDIREYYLNKKDLQRITILDNIYKTKAEAEHYLHHANIARTEKLPFLTWEEFNKKKSFGFLSHNYNYYSLYLLRTLFGKAERICLTNTYTNEDKLLLNNTEQNFYKAYDECVRLFKGE